MTTSSSENLDAFTESAGSESITIHEDLNRNYLIPAVWEMIAYAAATSTGEVLKRKEIAKALGYNNLSQRIQAAGEGVKEVSFDVLMKASVKFKIPVGYFLRFSDYYPGYQAWHADGLKALSEFQLLVDRNRSQTLCGDFETEYFFDDATCSPWSQIRIVPDLYIEKLPALRMRGAAEIPMAEVRPSVTFKVGDRFGIEVSGLRSRNVVVLEARLDSHGRRDWRLVDSGDTGFDGKFTIRGMFREGTGTGRFRLAALLVDKSVNFERWQDINNGALCPLNLLRDFSDRLVATSQDAACQLTTVNYELLPK